jgi:hypothetical protein
MRKWPRKDFGVKIVRFPRWVVLRRYHSLAGMLEKRRCSLKIINLNMIATTTNPVGVRRYMCQHLVVTFVVAVNCYCGGAI